MREMMANRNFLRLWLAQIVLSLGDSLMQMGLLELFRTHGFDPRVETAKLLFAVALPGLLLGPVAMAYLDRWQRRSVLMVSDAVRAGLVLVITFWLLPLLTGKVEERGLLMVYCAIGIIGAIATFYLPARAALIPNLVTDDKLVKANTLFATTLAVATVGGRALGGFVAETCGVTWAVMANALMYVISVGLLWSIQMPPHVTSRTASVHARNGWREFVTGLEYLWRHPTAAPLVVLSGAFAFLLGILVVVFVGYAMNTLGLKTGGVGYLIAAGGVGAATGIGLLGRDRPWTRSDWLPVGQLAAAAVAIVLLSVTTSVAVACVLVVALGAVAATVMIQIDARMQSQVPDERRGAVFAARGMLTSATMIVAFWLQFGTEFLRTTPPPVVLFWLGTGAGIVAVMTLVVLWGKTAR
jgi:MFS family permease